MSKYLVKKDCSLGAITRKNLNNFVAKQLLHFVFSWRTVLEKEYGPVTMNKLYVNEVNLRELDSS